MHKHQQFNFFSNVIKYVKPTYGNKEELLPLRPCTKLALQETGLGVALGVKVSNCFLGHSYLESKLQYYYSSQNNSYFAY